MPVRSSKALTRLLTAAVALAGVVVPSPNAGALLAQQVALAVGGPRFLYASSKTARPVEVDASRTTILRQRISLNLDRPTVGTLLGAIAKQTGLEFVYSREVVPVDRVVGLHADSITVAAALTEILVDTGLDVLLSPGRQVTLIERRVLNGTRVTGSITGRVTDANTGAGVQAAEVFLNETRWRTSTDSAGRYRLEGIDTGAYTVTVRKLGYSKQSQPVTVRDQHEDTVDVVLAPVATRLNELVTTATGRQRRMDIANDITTINADSVMQTAPITSVTDLLEGRVPGLTVQHTSGAPGDPARLRLRGAGSPLRSNDPIVVVDGVRVYADQSAARSTNLAGIRDTSQVNNGSAYNASYATPSPLDYIDPNSIETIEVVKGPSAATLYGQDAANGVIVITTKKGKAGPTRWNATAEHGWKRIEGDYPDLMLQWGHLLDNNTSVVCQVGDVVGSSSQNGKECQPDSVVTFQMLNDPALTMLDPGHRTAATLGVSGGSSTLTYAVTGSYQNELGLPKLPAYEADRYQTNLGTSPPDWMRRPQHLTQWGVTSRVAARLGGQADLSLTSNLSRTAQQRSSLEQQLGKLMATYIDPTTGEYFYGNTRWVYDYTGELLSNYFERATATATQFTNGLNLSWRPHSWLTMTADAGLNLTQRADEIYFPSGITTDIDSSGHLDAGQGTSVVSTVNLRGLATVPLKLGLQLRFAAGVNYTGTSIRDQTVQTSSLAAGTSLQGGAIDAFRRSLGDDATFGWYVEPSLSHRRFSFSTGLRLDSGSGYGGGVTLPKFPKLGFTYLLSDEPWFPFKDQFQSLRLRVAYGRASRQPGITERLRLYGTTQQIWTDGQFQDGVYLQTLGNTELRPERSSEFEGGFDADLLDNRLNVSLTGYRKTTDDAILSVPVPPSVYSNGCCGDVTIQKNIGVIRNTGLELTLAAQLLRSGPVTWGTQLMLSQNRNVVVKLGPGVEPFYTQTSGNYGSGLRVAPAYPLFGRWAKPILGYADANGDGVLGSDEILLGDTSVYVGQTLPNYEATLNTTLTFWHGAVAVTAALLYQDGLSQRNELWEQLGVFSRGRNDPTASLADQLASAYLETDYNYNQTVNTVRFNSLSVRYRMPAAISQRLGAQQLDIAVQGGNLGLWTNYRGLDPNVNAFSTGNSITDLGVLPEPRTWQVRVNATY